MTTNGRQFRLQSLSGTTKHLSLMITIKLTFLFRSNSVEFCNYFLYTKPSRHFLKVLQSLIDENVWRYILIFYTD